MNLFLPFYFFVLVYFIDAISSSFQRCEEISFSVTDETSNNISLTLYVSRSNDKNVITVKQFLQITDQLCINDQCFRNLNDTLIVEDGMFFVETYTRIVPSGILQLFWGYINEANFIFYDGRMFSDGNECLSYADIDIHYLNVEGFSFQTCCKSFQAVTVPPSNSPKCTNLNLSSTVFNIFNNAIIGTTAADFVISENNILGKGKFSLQHSPFEYEFLYAINTINTMREEMACQWSSTNIQYCYFPIENVDRTLMFFVQQINAWPPALAGKLIIRDGQALITEGTPFSKENMCQNITHSMLVRTTFMDDWPVNVISQFCCTSFDSASPPPIKDLPSNITEQKCDGIQTSSTFATLNLNMSAALRVTKINDSMNTINIANFNLETSLNKTNFQLCSSGIMSYSCSNFSTVMNFTVDNSPIILALQTKLIDDNGYPYQPFLFTGIVDQGSLISYDGSLFDMNKQKCSTFKDDPLTVESCCSSINQNTASIPIVEPRCTNFYASSTFYNTTDDSIYVTASANFVITDSDIIGIGDFSNRFAIRYGINGYPFEIGVNGTQFGGFPLNNKNSEFLIHLSYFYLFYDSPHDGTLFVGRILLLEGKTFWDQNIPYSATNNCYNFTYADDYHTLKVVSQFCCNAFADSDGNQTSVTSTSPTSLSTTTSDSSVYKTSFTAILFVTFMLECIFIL